MSGRSIWYLAIVIGVSYLCTTCSPESVLINSESDTEYPTRTSVVAESDLDAEDDTTFEDSTASDAYQSDRDWMVDQTIISRGVADPDVLRAMRTVPRHEFVPDDYLGQAYDDHPLPIGYGQTISQPYIVAWMTELLQLKTGDKVLEIGTGSGYQAAVLAELGFVDVYSIEIVPELASQAMEHLSRLGYSKVHVKEGNGYYGWEAYAPYDAIIVTAAPDHLPQALLQQLSDGGILVIPIGPPGGYQSLWQFVKSEDTIQAFNQGGVRFVPFTAGGVEESVTDPP